MSRRLAPLPKVAKTDPAVLIARIQAKEKAKQNAAVLRRELVLSMCRVLRRKVKKGSVQ